MPKASSIPHPVGVLRTTIDVPYTQTHRHTYIRHRLIDHVSRSGRCTVYHSGRGGSPRAATVRMMENQLDALQMISRLFFLRFMLFVFLPIVLTRCLSISLCFSVRTFLLHKVLLQSFKTLPYAGNGFCSQGNRSVQDLSIVQPPSITTAIAIVAIDIRHKSAGSNSLQNVRQ